MLTGAMFFAEVSALGTGHLERYSESALVETRTVGLISEETVVFRAGEGAPTIPSTGIIKFGGFIICYVVRWREKTFIYKDK